jgi:hypothetical protein
VDLSVECGDTTEKSRRASITALGGVPVMDEKGEHITFASRDEGLSTDI